MRSFSRFAIIRKFVLPALFIVFVLSAASSPPVKAQKAKAADEQELLKLNATLTAMTAKAYGSIVTNVFGVRLQSNQGGTDTGTLKVMQGGV